MSIATVLIAAAGWILAAFLCGLAVGRERGHPKTEKPGKVPHSAKTTAIAPEEKALREWRNFLTYDGTEQSGPVE